MTKIRGTFKDPTGATLAGGTIKLIPKYEPMESGGAVIVPVPLTIILDGSGRFGYSPEYSVVPGTYQLVLSDLYTTTISVPNEVGPVDVAVIASLSSAVNASGRPLPALSGGTFSRAVATTGVVKAVNTDLSRNRPAYRMFFFGGMTDGTNAGDRFAAVAGTLGGNEGFATIVLGNSNLPNGAVGTFNTNLGNFVTENPFFGNDLYYSPGTTDWHPSTGTDGCTAHLFPNASGHRYGYVKIGPILVVSLSLGDGEASLDGVGTSSAQATWARTVMSTVSASLKIVVAAKRPKTNITTGDGVTAVNTSAYGWILQLGADMVIVSDGNGYYTRWDGTDTDSPLVELGSGAVPGSLPVPLVTTPSDVAVTELGVSGFAELSLIGYRAVLKFYDAVSGAILDTYFWDTLSTDSVAALELVLPDYSGLFTTTRLIPSDPIPLPTAQGLAPGIGLNFGPGEGQAWTGWALYDALSYGRLISVAELPSGTAVLASPYLQRSLYLVGDNPPKLHYWDAHSQVFRIFATAETATGNGNSNPLPKCPTPLIGPRSAGGDHLYGITRSSTSEKIFYRLYGSPVPPNGLADPDSAFTEITTFPYDSGLTAEVAVPLIDNGVVYLAAYAARATYGTSDVSRLPITTLRSTIGFAP